ncbi:MAG: sulfite exporter TauE/SafE family protein [Cyanobacteria bacterium P01_A01_bin.3]
MPLAWLCLASCASWLVSSITGCGSSVVLIPLVSCFLGIQAVAPILTVGMLMGNGHRVALYWQDIDRRVVSCFVPGSVVGACLGAWAISRVQIEWIGLLLGAILILSALGMFEGSEPKSPRVKAWHFLPAGMGYSCLSGLVGTAGPLLNVLYLGYGLSKEAMISTKSANQVFMHTIKIAFYCAFGIMSPEYLGYGLAIGLAAVPGNWLGRTLLARMNDTSFRKCAFAFISIAGMYLLWDQRAILETGRQILASLSGQ